LLPKSVVNDVSSPNTSRAIHFGILELATSLY
jgi:hypothetical protein